MKNTESSNQILPSIIPSVVQWHHDRNLIAGGTDESQTEKLFEEFSELVASNMPNRSAFDIYIAIAKMNENLYERKKHKPVTAEEAPLAKKDACGDMMVVLLNVMERNGWTVEETLYHAYDEIKDRKGMLICGSFVKAKDLTLYRDEIEAMGLDYTEVLKENGV